MMLYYLDNGEDREEHDEGIFDFGTLVDADVRALVALQKWRIEATLPTPPVWEPKHGPRSFAFWLQSDTFARQDMRGDEPDGWVWYMPYEATALELATWIEVLAMLDAAGAQERSPTHNAVDLLREYVRTGGDVPVHTNNCPVRWGNPCTCEEAE